MIPDVGIYEGVSIDTYHGEWEACGSTNLRHMDRSAAFCRWMATHPKPPTPAQRLGTACHYAVLEPDKFEGAYSVAGRCQGIKGDGKQCSHTGNVRRAGSWFCGIHKPDSIEDDPGIVMVRDEYDKARRMRDAVKSHPAASAILGRTTRRETSVVWDESWGVAFEGPVLSERPKVVRCKARPDVLADDLLCDVKTTRDLFGPHDVDRWVAKKMIHMQTAFYRAGLQAAGRPVKECCLIVVHSEPPHEVGVFTLEPEALRCGDERVRRLLEKYARCVATGEWPAWPLGVLPADVPAWEVRAMFPEEATG
jgi:exodeoxyribonuclease VIII